MHALAVLISVAGVPSIYAGDEYAAADVKEHRFGGEDAVRPEFARTSSAFQSWCSSVLETTYFLAALIVWTKGSIQSGRASGGVDRHPDCISSYVTRPKRRASACLRFSTA